MKNKSRFLRLLIISYWMLTLFTGCIPTTSLSPNPSEQAVTDLYPAPIKSIQPKPTEIPINPIPTATSTVKPTQWTPISTTSIQTLTSDERRARILELIKTNNNCMLPCWWGIEPGKSSWPSVASFLQGLGAKVGSINDGNGEIFHGTGGFDFEAEQIHNNFGFTEAEGIVQSVHITSEGYSNPSFFQSAWENYSIRNVLQRYGSPSRVFLTSDSKKWGNRDTQPYKLWIAYDPLGFIIQYDGFAEDGTMLRICPRFEEGQDIANLRMFLQSPESSVPLDPVNDFAQIDRWRIRTIEDAAGLSTDDFYKLFLPNSNNSCFETPADIWP